MVLHTVDADWDWDKAFAQTWSGTGFKPSHLFTTGIP